MKYYTTITILLFLLSSCKNDGGSKDASTAQKGSENSPNEIYRIDVHELSKDFMRWYQYTYNNIKLQQAFTARDENGKDIGKTDFLHNLERGDYIAVKIEKHDNVPVYKLYQYEGTDPDIKKVTIQLAQTALTLASMEGKELPEFHFTDVKGNTYDQNSTKGKLLLIKCWFIHCGTCVKEFPELNRLVDQYKNRNDIQFISLASDTRGELIEFLNKKPFSYAVIPGMAHYMNDQLKVNAYPMHILVNRNGRIVKVTNSIEDILPFFKKESAS
jgi:thiol-disulfide isomerase/thioredoxin